MPARTLHHPSLGELRWEPDEDAWRVPIELWGRSCDLAVIHDPGAWEGPADPSAQVAAAAGVVDQLRARQAAVDEAIVGSLLALYNDSWRGDRSLETAASFVASLTCVELAVYPTGDAELSFEDGGLFEGHLVVVSLDADCEIVDAGLAG